MKTFAKVLWAIDPYDEPSRRDMPLKTLKYLVEATGSIIQPVYVVPMVAQDARDHGPSDFSVDQKVIASLFKGIYLKNLLPPLVVRTPSENSNQITDALLSYAARINADLILADTHDWSGLRRVFRVNFVNRLLQRSAIPVMALGPEVREIRPFDRILYATHLDPRSNLDFRRVVEIASSFHSELTVLHLVSRRERDQDGADSTAVGESLPQRSRLMRRARAWSNWASRRGIVANVVLQDSSVQVTEHIQRLADRHRVGLILLESRSGPWTSLFKGAKVQEIVRNALCPVWVMRLSKKKAVSKSSQGPERSAA